MLWAGELRSAMDQTDANKLNGNKKRASSSNQPHGGCSLFSSIPPVIVCILGMSWLDAALCWKPRWHLAQAFQQLGLMHLLHLVTIVCDLVTYNLDYCNTSRSCLWRLHININWCKIWQLNLLTGTHCMELCLHVCLKLTFLFSWNKLFWNINDGWDYSSAWGTCFLQPWFCCGRGQAVERVELAKKLACLSNPQKHSMHNIRNLSLVSRVP